MVELVNLLTELVYMYILYSPGSL